MGVNDFTVVVPMAAKPKARPNFDSRSKRAYMPADYEAWSEEFAMRTKIAGLKRQRGPLELYVVLSREETVLTVAPMEAQETRSGLLTGDVDNYLGGVMDSLNGVIWDDDRQIYRATVTLDYWRNEG